MYWISYQIRTFLLFLANLFPEEPTELEFYLNQNEQEIFIIRDKYNSTTRLKIDDQISLLIDDQEFIYQIIGYIYTEYSRPDRIILDKIQEINLVQKLTPINHPVIYWILYQINDFFLYLAFMIHMELDFYLITTDEPVFLKREKWKQLPTIGSHIELTIDDQTLKYRIISRKEHKSSKKDQIFVELVNPLLERNF